jgi:hypothetical protein
LPFISDPSHEVCWSRIKLSRHEQKGMTRIQEGIIIISENDDLLSIYLYIKCDFSSATKQSFGGSVADEARGQALFAKGWVALCQKTITPEIKKR